MRTIIALSVLQLVLWGSPAFALCSSYPNTLTNGTVADANQIMANFNCAALTTGATLSGATLDGTTTLSGPTSFISPSTIVSIISTNGDAWDAISFNSKNIDGSNNDWLSGPSITAENDYQIARGTPSSAVVLLDILASGNVGIGTHAPGYLLTVAGTVYASGAAGALSDIRHKKDVSPLRDGALNDVLKLKPVSFYWKNPRDGGMQGRQMGFVAQDVEKILPSVVLTDSNAEKTKGLKYNELIAVLTKALQEEEAQIRSLQDEAARQAALIKQLQGRQTALDAIPQGG